MDFQEDIRQCLTVLKNGGVILYPTDTIWGLGCDATNPGAVEKIIRLKNRPAEKSFVVLVADERDVLKYTAAPDLAVFDFIGNQEKPVTVIYAHAIGIAENAVAEDGSVAIRIVQDAFCRALIRRFRKPIISTSVNLSGEKAARIFPEINPAILQAVDYAVRYRRTDTAAHAASMLIRWENGIPDIIRR